MKKYKAAYWANEDATKKKKAPPPPPPQELPTPPPPGKRTWMDSPPPMPPTLRSLASQAAQTAAGVVNYVGGVESKQARNAALVTGAGAVAAARGLQGIGTAEDKLMQPLREYIGGSFKETAAFAGRVASKYAARFARTMQELTDEEREEGWMALQGANYFFGLPYDTRPYKEYLKNPSAGAAPGTQPASQLTPSASASAYAATAFRQPGAQPAAPTQTYSFGTNNGTPINGINVRSQPGSNNALVGTLWRDSTPSVTITKIDGDWGQLADGSGWVFMPYLEANK